MPNRILRPGILDSERVDQLDAHEETFYRRLMSVVDDYGRFDARPAMLRSALFPLRTGRVREADIPRWLATCEKAGLIALYEVDGKPYLELLDLGAPRAKASKFPDPPPTTSARIRSHVRADGPSTNSGTSTNSGSGTSARDSSEPPGTAASEPDATFPIYPVVGKERTWTLTPKFQKSLSDAYPDLNVDGECRKAHGWATANRPKRKTYRGMESFLFSWCGRAQNGRGANGTPSHNPKRAPASRAKFDRQLPVGSQSPDDLPD